MTPESTPPFLGDDGIPKSQGLQHRRGKPCGRDFFGYAVSLDSDTLAVGAPGEDSSATGLNGNQADNSAQSSGAIYMFTRSGTTWTQQAYVKASNTSGGDFFGGSVALLCDTFAVGAFYEQSSATGVNGNQADNSADLSGAVYVFTRVGTTWTQEAYIKSPKTQFGDFFGTSVAVSADALAVGAPFEDTEVGAVYVY